MNTPSSFYIAVIENAALLVAAAVLYDFVWLRFEKQRKILVQILLGLLLSGLCILLMKNPWIYENGIVFDTRSILLTITGIFFGSLTTIISMIGAAIFRYTLGGDGVYMGIAVILSSAIIAMLWRNFWPSIRQNHQIVGVYLVSLFVHLVMLACTYFLPEDKRWETLKTIALPVIIVYPAATSLIAKLLLHREKNWETKINLAESEQKYRLLAEHANDIIYSYRLKPVSGFEYVSPSVTHLTGYTPEEHYADPLLVIKLIHPDDATILQDLTAGKNFNTPIQLRWLKKNGDILWVEQINSPIFDEDGELVRINGIARDITERKLSEKRLKEQQELLNNIVDNLSGFIYRCNNDPHRTMLYLSPTVKKVTGYEVDELLNNQLLSFNDIILPPFRQYLWDKWQQVLSQKERFVDEYQIQTKSGEIRWVWEQGKGVYDKKGNLLYLDGYILDITGRKLAERKALEKEHEFREIFNATTEAIIIYDTKNGQIVDCNERAITMYGYESKEEFLKNTAATLSADIAPYYNQQIGEFSQKAASEGPQRFDWLAKRKNGDRFWIEVSLKRTFIGGKERDLAVIRDISERKSYEQELIKAKEKVEASDRLKTVFLQTLSHEVRTPLNAILGFSDLLLSNIENNRQHDYLKMINTSGKQLLGIISDILEMSMIDTGSINLLPETFEFKQLIDSLVEEYRIKAQLKGLEFESKIDQASEKLILKTDWYKLHKVISNLLNNALNYTQQGKISLNCRTQKNKAIISIKDTGIGIPKNDIPLVFEKFYRVKTNLQPTTSGIGLGLAIVKAYVDLLGGKIRLDSVENEGTTVTIEIPLKPNTVKGYNQIYNIPESLSGNGELILIVDDDPACGEYLEVVLRAANYRTLTIISGERAVEMAAHNDAIKLVLMDLKLPGISGIAAMQRIKSLRPSLPVIAQTAYNFYPDQSNILQVGFDVYIVKPLNEHKVLSSVYQCLRKK